MRPTKKGKVRVQWSAAVHFMRNRGWETLINESVQKGWKRDVLLDNSRWTHAANGGLVLLAYVCLHGTPGGLTGGDMKRLR